MGPGPMDSARWDRTVGPALWDRPLGPMALPAMPADLRSLLPGLLGSRNRRSVRTIRDQPKRERDQADGAHQAERYATRGSRAFPRGPSILASLLCDDDSKWDRASSVFTRARSQLTKVAPRCTGNAVLAESPRQRPKRSPPSPSWVRAIPRVRTSSRREPSKQKSGGTSGSRSGPRIRQTRT